MTARLPAALIVALIIGGRGMGMSQDDDPKDARSHLLRGAKLDKQEKFAEAADALTKAIALDDKLAEAYQLRGMVHFKLGKITESIADFDKFIELNPKAKPGHWQRGISYYYARRYDDGKKQFEGYQTVDANDVENVVWRYLCMARKGGVAKARADLLKIGDDKRVPMKEVYELFAGRRKPADVLAAAKKTDPKKQRLAPLFYAHLYLGLYYETEGDAKRALEHLNKATDDYRTGEYMWHVARVHRELLRKAEKKKSSD